MNVTRIVPWLVFLLIVCSIQMAVVTAQEPELPVETRNFMRGKLQHAQKILEGLMNEEFTSVERHAQELSLLSMESQWNVLRTSQYVDQSADFRHAIQHLIDAAKAKKIDAAALAYVDVTLKCIHCHKYVRDRNSKEGLGLLPVPQRAERLSVSGRPASATP